MNPFTQFIGSLPIRETCKPVVQAKATAPIAARETGLPYQFRLFGQDVGGLLQTDCPEIGIWLAWKERLSDHAGYFDPAVTPVQFAVELSLAR